MIVTGIFIGVYWIENRSIRSAIDTPVRYNRHWRQTIVPIAIILIEPRQVKFLRRTVWYRWVDWNLVNLRFQRFSTLLLTILIPCFQRWKKTTKIPLTDLWVIHWRILGASVSQLPSVLTFDPKQKLQKKRDTISSVTKKGGKIHVGRGERLIKRFRDILAGSWNPRASYLLRKLRRKNRWGKKSGALFLCRFAFVL